MPPILALLLTVALIVYLFWRDRQHMQNVTPALWLPLAWFLVITTRTPSQWCIMFGFHPPGGGDVESGTPFDAIIFFALILGGLYVLQQRRIKLADVARYNRLLIVFFVYCFLACLWSESPFVAFKRFIKVLGHPILALVILTEPDPEEALYLVLKRTAYIFLPISFTFIKYFPQWGRGFDGWTGAPHDIGITLDKNALGAGCMILGFFWFCYTDKIWHFPKNNYRKQELFICALFLFLSLWVIHKAHSTTSLVSMAIAIGFALIAGLRIVNPYRLGTYIVVVAISTIAIDQIFGIHDKVIEMLGKDPTLTDRTKVWHDLFQVSINPIIGTGFESFWLGERLDYMWSIYWWHPMQAHNGYIETYLNLGLVGLFFMLALIVSAFRRGQRMFFQQFDLGRFRMGFVLAYIFYNWTEAAFKALDPLWFVFFIVLIDFPMLQPNTAPVLAEAPSDTPPMRGQQPGGVAVGK